MGEATKEQLLGNPVNAIAAATEPLARRPLAPAGFGPAIHVNFVISDFAFWH